MRLFFALFPVLFAATAALLIGCLGLASHFLHTDISAWQQVTSWRSPLCLASLALAGLSAVLALVLCLVWKTIVRILSTPPPRKTPRPQSNRPTST